MCDCQQLQVLQEAFETDSKVSQSPETPKMFNFSALKTFLHTHTKKIENKKHFEPLWIIYSFRITLRRVNGF